MLIKEYKMSRTLRHCYIFELVDKKKNRGTVDKKHGEMVVTDGMVSSPLYNEFTKDGRGFKGYPEMVFNSPVKKQFKRIRSKKQRRSVDFSLEE